MQLSVVAPPFNKVLLDVAEIKIRLRFQAAITNHHAQITATTIGDHVIAEINRQFVVNRVFVV
jgi:hypothetical protein